MLFSQNTYKALKADIKNTLIHQGFLFSTLSQTKATVDTKEHSVDIHIDCQLNHKIKFGQTVYHGTGLSKKFLDRFSIVEEHAGDNIKKQTPKDFQRLWKIAKQKLAGKIP